MEGIRAFLRYFAIVEASLAALSVVMALYITSDSPFSPGVFGYFALMLFLFTSMFGPATALRLMRARGAGPVDVRIPLGVVSVFFAALIVLTFFVPFGFGDVRTEEYTLYNEPLPSASVTLDHDIEGIYYIGGNVEFSGNVTVRNATLVFSPGSRVWVKQGSSLRVENTVLELHGSQFEVYGSLVAVNALFRGPWGDSEHMNGDGGVEIYGEVWMENSTVVEGATNGLLLYNATAHLVNVTVSSCGDDGLEMYRSTLQAERLRIQNNTWSIVVFESEAVLRDSVVSGNTYGIALDDSHLTLINSTVSGNREWDLLKLGDSRVDSVESTVGVEAEFGAEDPYEEAYLMLCVSVYMISFLMAITYTHWVARTLSGDRADAEEKLFNYG